MTEQRMQKASMQKSSDVRFPITFIISTLFLLLAKAYLPLPVLQLWRDLAMYLTKLIGKATGVTVVNRGEIMSVNGFQMLIVDECTAIHYIVIIACAILSSLNHSMLYRLTGLSVAIPVIFLFNSIRLLVTGLAGTISPGAFGFVHDYLGVCLFVLLTVGIWITWERDFKVPVSYRHLFLALGLCTLFQFLLFVISDQVGMVMTALASHIAGLLPGTSAVTIGWGEGMVLFKRGQYAFSGSFGAEITVVSVYAGIATTCLACKGWSNSAVILAGGVFILFSCCLIIALCGVVVLNWGVNSALLYLWLSQGFLLALPLLLLPKAVCIQKSASAT